MSNITEENFVFYEGEEQVFDLNGKNLLFRVGSIHLITIGQNLENWQKSILNNVHKNI